MVKDFKALIVNPVTVSFRLEYAGDLVTVAKLILRLSEEGSVIDLRTHLNKANLTLMEPYVEIVTDEATLQQLVTLMNNPKLNLHVGLDTMQRLPMEQSTLERQYGKGEFNKF